MSRYIDAVIAAEKVSEKHNIPLSELVDNFAEIPSADVVEVKRGKWIRHEQDGAIFADYECSVCSAYPTGGIRSNYCPNCGADMRGDKR